jgi:hypothetical protein
MTTTSKSFGCIQWLICLICACISTLIHAQSLPPAPTYLGDIHRDASGKIIAETDQAVAASTSFSTSQPKLINCETNALTCIEISSTSNLEQANLPVTFGQPFRKGDITKGSGLVAVDDKGVSLPLQMDQAATYPDGSIRFAVLSTRVNA